MWKLWKSLNTRQYFRLWKKVIVKTEKTPSYLFLAFDPILFFYTLAKIVCEKFLARVQRVEFFNSIHTQCVVLGLLTPRIFPLCIRSNSHVGGQEKGKMRSLWLYDVGNSEMKWCDKSGRKAPCCNTRTSKPQKLSRATNLFYKAACALIPAISKTKGRRMVGKSTCLWKRGCKYCCWQLFSFTHCLDAPEHLLSLS